MTDAEYQRKYDRLNSYQELQHQINGLTNELTKWAAIGTNIAQKYEQGFGGGDCDSKTERGGTGLAVIQAQIKAELSQAINNRDSVLKAIAKATKKRHKAILTYKFVNGMSNSQIADMIGKDIRNVRRAVHSAVDSIEL